MRYRIGHVHRAHRLFSPRKDPHMISRDMEEAMRAIAREEIALDEMRRIEREDQQRETILVDIRAAIPSAPGTIHFAAEEDR
jgi:hypothetical protein